MIDMILDTYSFILIFFQEYLHAYRSFNGLFLLARANFMCSATYRTFLTTSQQSWDVVIRLTFSPLH
jgi:hypothetical protein